VNKYNNLQEFSLSYTSLKIEDDNTNNKIIKLANTPDLHRESVNNTNTNIRISQGLDSSSIPYIENQLTKPR